MDTLKRDIIEFLKIEKNQTVLLAAEEYDYFHPKKKPAILKKQMPEMHELVSKILPEVTLSGHIPDDSHAKKMSNLWKEHHLSAKMIVLSLGEQGQHLQFLQNFTKALHSLLGPTQLIEMRRIERDNTWDITLSSKSLKLVIAPPFDLWKSLSLSKFYLENPVTQLTSLKDISLLCMKPISSYLQNPHLKRELWKTVSTHPSLLM